MKHLLLIFCLTCVFSCGSSTSENSKGDSDEPSSSAENLKPGASQAEIDQVLINDYITRKKLKTKKLKSGLHYVLLEEGGAEKPHLRSLVVAHYTGKLLNGKEFDSSRKKPDPFKFRLNGVVDGWKEGIPLMGRGGKGTLIIPSGMAYGARKVGSIPPNSVLVFDIEIFDFQ